MRILNTLNFGIIVDGFFVILYLIILLFVLYGVLHVVAAIVRLLKRRVGKSNLTFFLIKVPELNEIEIEVAEQMFASLHSIQKGFLQRLFSEQEHVSFEIIGKETDISFYVSCPTDLSTLVEKQINAAYPSAEIDIVKPPQVWTGGKETEIASLILKGPPYYPIRVFEDLPSDGISSITSAMSKLGENETLAFQMLLRPSDGSWVAAGNRFSGSIKAHNSNPEKKQANIDQSFLEGVDKKLAKSGFDVIIRLVSVSDDKFKATSNLRNLMGTFEQFTDVKYNKFVSQRIWNKHKFIHDFVFRKFSSHELFIPFFDIYLYRDASLLNSVELATIYHFPNEEIKTPRINWLRSKRASAPPNLPEEGLYLGDCEFRGVAKEVRITNDDRRRHFYIVGQTGTGKSQFMKFQAIQDIQNGNGIGFIDPHGSEVEDLLNYIPASRMNDVIYFDAGDEERPMGLNILDTKSESQRHLIINSFIALLYKLYDPNRQGIMGPMLERAIRNVMLTAMDEPGSTMVEVLRLLIDNKYAQSRIPFIKDPLVKKYWTDELANTSQQKKGENLGYFVSKFDRFVTEKMMRNIVGQPKSAFDFREVMDQKKILLVNLSKGKIGEENSNFLGLVLVPRILAAAMSRADVLGKQDFPDFYLYVDEFQNFSTPDIATILSEARKYKLCMIMANQFIAQLSDDIKTAVFGNVGTVNAFRIGVDDAEYLENQFKPVFAKEDLINLPVGNSYIRLLIKGQPSQPFSLHVPWDKLNAIPKNKELAREIRELSRLKYGKDRHIVEEDINRRAQV